MIAPGDLLAGKYAVGRMLGKGGMGYVFAARHTQLGQPVAIKVLMPELCENPSAVARFLREAQAAVRIRGEHVARVLDVGAADAAMPYMVMEFLEGRDLARELSARGTLPIEEAVDYVLQACEALAEAHTIGLVHRDLKPANLFLTHRPDGSALVKVLDFGISKALPTAEDQPDADHVTATQGLIGSPHYMSPEQIRTPKLVDTRSDIWSVGVILFQLLAGETPFTADTPMSILAAVVGDPVPRLRERREDVPTSLEEVVLRCLEKDPRRRYTNVEDLARDLQEYAPRGQEAVARISAIVNGRRDRTSSGPPPIKLGSDAPTLASGSDPPPEPSKIEAARRRMGDAGERPSAEGWGRSHGRITRSRRSLVFTLASVGAVGALLGVLAQTHKWGGNAPADRDFVGDGGHLGAPSTGDGRAVLSPTAVLVELGGPGAEPAPSANSASPVDAGAIAVGAVNSVVAVAPQVKTPPQSPKATVKPNVNVPAPLDPLDGRR